MQLQVDMQLVVSNRIIAYSVSGGETNEYQ